MNMHAHECMNMHALHEPSSPLRSETTTGISVSSVLAKAWMAQRKFLVKFVSKCNKAGRKELRHMGSCPSLAQQLSVALQFSSIKAKHPA